MSVSFWAFINSAAKMGVAKPTAAEIALLVLLGATLLAARVSRETYLRVWILGWSALVFSRLAENVLAARIPAPFDAVVVQSTFMLAVGLLAGAVLVYARNRDLVVPLAVITPILVGFAGARAL